MPRLLWAALALAAGAGCGSHRAEKKADDPMMMFASEPSTPKTPKADTPAAEAPDSPAPDADLAGLNMLLRDYVRTTRKVPRELNELVSSGFISALPSPPPGKRFAILMHPLGYQVVLLDR